MVLLINLIAHYPMRVTQTKATLELSKQQNNAINDAVNELLILSNSVTHLGVTH